MTLTMTASSSQLRIAVSWQRLSYLMQIGAQKDSPTWAGLSTYKQKIKPHVLHEAKSVESFLGPCIYCGSGYACIEFGRHGCTLIIQFLTQSAIWDQAI